MKNLLKLKFSILFCLILTSCATIFNSRNEKITFVSKRPAEISIAQKGIYNIEKELTISTTRSKLPLKITVNSADSLTNFEISA